MNDHNVNSQNKWIERKKNFDIKMQSIKIVLDLQFRISSFCSRNNHYGRFILSMLNKNNISIVIYLSEIKWLFNKLILSYFCEWRGDLRCSIYRDFEKELWKKRMFI